jgi:Alternative complex III, ActD subunit
MISLGKKFNGVWGTFEHLDEAATAIETLRKQGQDYSVLAPCPRHELTAAMGDPQSKIPYITLFCGAVGLFVGYAFPSWTALDWVLPVSAKPIVGIPAFTIIGFEMMVLLGGIGTAVAIFGLGFVDLIRKPLPRSERFKGYNRFSADRFGIVVRCPPDLADSVEKLMRSHSAEEVVREY